MPSTRKLPRPRLPPSTDGTPTVSQRPRRRGAETAFEYGEWIFPSSGPRAAPWGAPPDFQGIPEAFREGALPPRNGRSRDEPR